MKIQLNFVTIVLVLPTLTLAAFWETADFKSLEEAQQDCADYQRLSNETVVRYVKNGYPDDSCVRQMVFCVILHFNAWDASSSIRDHVISQLFKPSNTDSNYRNRTQDCLRETVDCLPKHDQEGRAYKSFLCYYRYYGNEIHYKECFGIKSVPRNVLHQFAAGDILDTEQFAEVYYIYKVAAGFYDPVVGFNFERAYVQFGNAEILSDSTKCCADSVRRQYQNEPKRLAETFKQCLQHIIPTLETIQKAAKDYLEETPENLLPLPSSPSCSKCGSPAPCT